MHGRWKCQKDNVCPKQKRSQRSQIIFVTRNLGNWTESLVTMEPSSRPCFPRDVLAAICSAALSSVDIALCLPTQRPSPSCSAQPRYLMSVIKTVPKLWWNKDRESGRGTYFSWQFVTRHLLHCTNIVVLFTYTFLELSYFCWNTWKH